MPFVANVRIEQLRNPTPSTASVRISFTVTGILTDLVEIYAGGASDPLSVPLQRVELSPPEINYTSDDIALQAGTLFFFHLCPRNKTGDQLDNEVEGQPFETFCTAAIPFTTQGTSPPAGPRPKPPAPSITAIEPRQPTLTEPGHIVVRWVANIVFDQYHVISEELPSGGPNEIEIDSSGNNGFFTLTPTVPGHSYSFKVQGCITHNIGLNDCSLFTAPKLVQMPENTRSLRTFLQISNIVLAPGLRSLGAAATAAGLRRTMHL
jgi:hypothetical protein